MDDILNFSVLGMFLLVGLWAGNRQRSWLRLLLVLACMAVVTQVWGMWFEAKMWQADFEKLSKQTATTPQIVDDRDPWFRSESPVQIGRYQWTVRTFTTPHIAAAMWAFFGYGVGRIGRFYWARRIRASSASVDPTPD